MTGVTFIQQAAFGLYAVLVVALALLTGRTLVGLARGEILKPE
jgi:hypothetical protein